MEYTSKTGLVIHYVPYINIFADIQKYKYLAQYDGSVYTYPAWAHWTGRILAASTMSCIPIGAIVALVKARVSIECC